MSTFQSNFKISDYNIRSSFQFYATEWENEEFYSHTSRASFDRWMQTIDFVKHPRDFCSNNVFMHRFSNPVSRGLFNPARLYCTLKMQHTIQKFVHKLICAWVFSNSQQEVSEGSKIDVIKQKLRNSSTKLVVVLVHRSETNKTLRGLRKGYICTIVRIIHFPRMLSHEFQLYKYHFREPLITFLLLSSSNGQQRKIFLTIK